MTTIKEWLMANIEKYSTKAELVDACVQELNVSRPTVYNKMNYHKIYPPDKDALPTATNGVIPAEEMLKRVDYVTQVEDYLRKEVGDNYIEEVVLKRNLGISNNKWDKVKMLPVFRERRISVEQKGRRVILWSSLEGIKTLKKHISLSRYEVL